MEIFGNAILCIFGFAFFAFSIWSGLLGIFANSITIKKKQVYGLKRIMIRSTVIGISILTGFIGYYIIFKII